MKVVIAGSGAMGGTYGCILKQAGNDVVFLDYWQDNIDAINEKGIDFSNIDSQEIVKAKAYKPKDYTEIPDLIVYFTKSMLLRSVLEDTAHLRGENTKVLCLLNGLGHIDTLKEYVNEKNILMGVTVLTANMKGPGKVVVTNYGKTEIQNVCECGKKGAMEVIDTMNAAKLPAEYSNSIRFSIWRKACINGTMNTCCAILDCNMKELGEIPNSKKLLRDIVSEFSIIAKAKDNVDLDIDEITNFVFWFTTSEFKGYLHHPSMHQDLIQNHRKTEIDYLNGYVSKMGKELNISTPTCDLLTLLIHAKESILKVK